MSEDAITESNASFHGLSVLVVEDETMIALLIEDMLLELGCAQVRHASSVAEALECLGSGRPDIAMLDVNLNREQVFPFAFRLEEAGIPFLFATGCGGPDLPDRIRAKPLLHKPFTVESLALTLVSALGLLGRDPAAGRRSA
jgi:CheY-like chemotaxis protein